MYSFKRADSSELPLVQTIAFATWPQTYEPILSKEQISYMLNLLYSHDALAKQFEEGHYFYFLYCNDELAGFASFELLNEGVWKLHKLYVMPSYQGTGTGSALLRFVINKTISLGAQQLLLNVNRQNRAINFYKKHGFVITEEADINIGNGFFMNDYIMMLDLSLHKF